MPKPMSPPRTPWETRIRTHMTAAGITTYKDLATRSGVSRISINNACKGDTTLSYHSAAAIARVLNISIERLMQ